MDCPQFALGDFFIVFLQNTPKKEAKTGDTHALTSFSFPRNVSDGKRRGRDLAKTPLAPFGGS